MTTETQADFARRLNRAPSWITQLKAAGRLVLTDDGLVDVESSLTRIEATEDPGKAGVAARHAEGRQAGKGMGEQVEKIGASFKLYQARKMKADAEMSEMERDRQAGKLVPIDGVNFLIDDLTASYRSRLENWPDRLAPELFPLTTLEDTRALLVESVEQLLNAIAGQIARRLDELKNAARD